MVGAKSERLTSLFGLAADAPSSRRRERGDVNEVNIPLSCSSISLLDDASKALWFHWPSRFNNRSPYGNDRYAESYAR